MSKIAICVSGETHSWNDLNKKSLLEVKKRLVARGHEVAIYGHTWKHCEIEKPTFFESLIVDDQDDIRKYIIQDSLLRTIYISDKRNNYASYTDDIKIHIERTVGILGQMFSVHRCLHRTPVGYDVYIRWRWDNKFGHASDVNVPDSNIDSDIELLLMNIETLPSSGKDFLSTIADLRFNGITQIQNTTLSHTEACFVDFIFAFSKNAHMKIVRDKTFESHVDDILKHRPVLHRIMSHEIWEIIFHRYDFKGRTSLPNIICT